MTGELRTWRDGKEGYPLPWCDALDAPYWVVNFQWCGSREGWRKWQAGKPMSEIIPEIDRLLPTAPDTPSR